MEEEFAKIWGRKPDWIVRAPGRVNLIGEHTDYNDGFVLPMAIPQAVWLALRERKDEEVHVHSTSFQERKSFSFNDLKTVPEPKSSGIDWIEYLKGTAWAMAHAHFPLKGWEGVLASDIPMGAGLSSSAALEMATARAFAALQRQAWDPKAMAKICQKAENDWVHVHCGIMDQMICGCGKENHALLIDCQDLTTRLCPLPPETSVIVMDTATRRGLVESAYNLRRSQCEKAASLLGVPTLRNAHLSQVSSLPQDLQPRARHVISENERTLKAAQAMVEGNASLLGLCMNESHESLKNDFQVTNEALNIMVDSARMHDACLGARMTGAGFGGCAVALVKKASAESFAHSMDYCYSSILKIEPHIYICDAANGAEVIA